MNPVRRDTSLFIAVLALAGGGAACIAAGGFAPAAARWGAALLGMAAAVGGVALQLLRRDCRRLAGQLARAADEVAAGGHGGDAGVESSATASPASADALRPIGRAANSLVAAAARQTAESALRAKELEIRLKVADAERRHAESIISGISDAVLVTDAFDELVLANASAARTFEFDAERSHRSPVQQVLRDARVIELIREMRQSHGGRPGPRVVEHQVRTAAGARTFKITLSPVPAHGAGSSPLTGAAPGGAEADEEPPAGVIAVLHDVTHEKEVAEMKNDFVSSVSHELRTPLASIKAYVELLIDGEADDEKTKREFYEVIQNEANRLGRLIDNILSISRIESGLVKVNKQPQSLTVVVKEAMEVIAPQAGMKQITLAEQLAPVFHQTHGDRDMLYQAVLNLLSNAIKYTPEGGRVTAETAVDEAGKRLIVRVTDTGVGVPPQDLPHVFDKFFRSESNSRMAKGTGLGLSLVKHIVETVHGGRVFAESEMGKGSCFGFEMELCE